MGETNSPLWSGRTNNHLLSACLRHISIPFFEFNTRNRYLFIPAFPSTPFPRSSLLPVWKCCQKGEKINTQKSDKRKRLSENTPVKKHFDLKNKALGQAFEFSLRSGWETCKLTPTQLSRLQSVQTPPLSPVFGSSIRVALHSLTLSQFPTL